MRRKRRIQPAATFPCTCRGAAPPESGDKIALAEVDARATLAPCRELRSAVFEMHAGQKVEPMTIPRAPNQGARRDRETVPFTVPPARTQMLRGEPT